MSQKIYSNLDIKGNATIGDIANATSDTDKFLVSDAGVVKYRTGSEMLSDLGVAPGVASNIQHQVKAGVAISKGQAVYVTGADGTNMIVGLASNSAESTSSKTMGLMASTVATNGFGNVIAEGLLAGLDTSTANAGDPVWLGTNGNLIYGLANKPSAPNHLVFIGIVTRSNANNGEIFVKVQNGFELNEIHDVDTKTTAPAGNDILAFEGAPVNLWKNKTIASVLGYTPYNASNPNGYISSYTETDPIYTASSWYSTVNNASNWNTAYGWGNHASAGYLTSVTNISGNAGTATQIYQDNEPVSGTYRLLLGNASDANGYAYNFNSLYFNKATNTIQGANVSGNAATATNADYANAAGTAGNLSGSINFATSGISAMKVNDTRYWVTDPNAPGNYFQALTIGNGSDFTQIGVNSSQEMYFRFNGSGNVWNTVLSSNNYSSFAVPNNRTITINGTSYDLSANRSFTVTAVEVDTLATVTARGALSTGNIFTPVNGGVFFNGNGLYGSGVYGSGNDLWFNAGSTQKAALNSSGDFTANNSVRSPIFYDSNNTTYYLDLANSTTSAVLNSKIIGKYIYRRETGGNNPVKTYEGVLATRSDNGGPHTYYVIETNVPQDDYQMGGFYIDLFGDYSATSKKTTIGVAGYWNPESNGGFIGFEATSTNPNVTPTIQVARKNSTGKTCFIITISGPNYPVIVARDLYFGYTAEDSASPSYGDGWSIVGTGDISGYSNNDSVVWNTSPTRTGGNASGTWGINVTGTSSNITAYTINQSVGTDNGPIFAEVYNNGWFRNNDSNEGLYNTTTTQHWSSNANGYWDASSTTTVSAIRFYTGGHVSALRGYVYANNGNEIGFLNNSGNWILRSTSSGNVYATADYRAPIFYDSNDTSYYVNPNSTSIMNVVQPYYLRRSTHSTGHLEGSYNNIGGNSANSNPIYTIGSSYNPSDSSLGGMYGIGYAHPNFWGSGKTSSWGLYVANAGVFNVTLGEGSTSIWAQNDIVAYSDIRVKDNIEVIENAIDKIKAIRGVTFTRKDALEEDKHKRHAGVIAQEVLKVLPEVVIGTEESKYSVAYGNMAGLFIEAIKEQQKQIDELKELVNQLIKK